MSSNNTNGHEGEHLSLLCENDRGETYKGVASQSLSGKTCYQWNTSKSSYSPENFCQRTTDFYCWNLDSDNMTRPWCYMAHGADERCDVRPCSEDWYTYRLEIETYTNVHTTKPTNCTIWQDLPSQWQHAAMGGVGIFFLLLLFLICLGCCWRRGKKRATGAKKCHYPSINGSLMNNTTNGATYYGNLNGSSAANKSNKAFELSSLLPSTPGHSPPRPIDPLPPEVPFYRLKFVELLGEGQFGKVMKGNLRGHGISYGAEPLQVAVKILKEDSLPRHRADFAKEVRYAAHLRHPNVVELIGVCSVNDEPVAAIFEYMIYGDLHELLRLRAHPPNVFMNELVANKERIAFVHGDFLHIITQIAAGMEYVVGMGYVHRDVATRNILVTYRHIIKIGDFGLMRDCYEKDYYQMRHRTMVPIRWMPPEALVYGKFSEASDVWAFGVTVWEIYSYGRQPHEGFDDQQVIELVCSHTHLKCPVNCPARIYNLMEECWLENPTRRPCFAELRSRLQVWSVISSSAQS